MSKTNGKPQTAADLLGLDPVDLYFPCRDCDHPIEQHDKGQACVVQEAILSWSKGEKDEVVPEIGPCPCPGFVGALEDGKPRAIRMRMPSNREWSTLQPGASLPAELGEEVPPEVALEKRKELREARDEWSRRVVKASVTHIRSVEDGKETWQECRVVDSRADIAGPWDLPIDVIDRGGANIVKALAVALVRDYNDGGPFGGVMRSFRSR